MSEDAVRLLSPELVIIVRWGKGSLYSNLWFVRLSAPKAGNCGQTHAKTGARSLTRRA